ncbi:MAG TPA: alpha/beta hydrolase [Acidimicrobiales bacterium]|nr:alpha/beta hydrolase [Acidimicrobiales bacterium]
MTEASDRERVVFLHGQPGAGVEWHRVVERLGSAVDAVTPDRPGYASNPLAAGGFAANAEWLIGVVEDCGAEPVAIAAHSWSGGVALSLALRRPDLVRGIVLVSSIGPGAVSRVDRLLANPAVGLPIMRATFRVANPAMRWFLSRFGPAGEARTAALDALDASHARGAWRAFVTEQVALVDELPGLLDQLGSVAAPVTVLSGTRDRVVPALTAAELAARLPRATLVPVRGGRHQLHRTHPGLVADAVRDVLAKTRSS